MNYIYVADYVRSRFHPANTQIRPTHELMDTHKCIGEHTNLIKLPAVKLCS
jgi:hypothetical protein